MIEIIITVYQCKENIHTFDILHNSESTAKNTDFLLKFKNLAQAKTAIIDITKVSDGDFQFEDLGDNIHLVHIKTPKLVTNSLFKSSRKKSQYQFLPIDDMELENLPPHLHSVITTIKSKLIKLPPVRANFGGAAGRSKDWELGFGLVPAADTSKKDWEQISDFIIELDPKHPKFSLNEKGEIYSPNGSQYKRVGQGLNFGELAVVVADKIPEAIASQLGMKRELGSIFFQPPTKKIKTDDVAIDTFILQQTMEVTKRNFQKVKLKQQRQGKKRSCTQASLFGNVSAKQAAEEAGAEIAFYKDMPDTALEWTHLIAHEMNGLQAKENLVVASHDCNTVMMHIEAAIKWFASRDHVINLSVEADIFNTPLGQKYNVAKMIRYTIKIDDSEAFTFELDPFLSIAPPKNLYKVFKGYFEYMQTKKVEAVESTTPVTVFFADKKEEMKLPDTTPAIKTPRRCLLADFR